MRIAEFPSVAAYLESAPTRSFDEILDDINAIYGNRRMTRMSAFDREMLEAAMTRRSDFPAPAFADQR